MADEQPLSSDQEAPDWDRMPAADGWRVSWARGEGCGEIAQLLDPGAERVTGDRTQHLVERRANLLVGKKLSSSFDLIDSAVPANVQFERIDGVTAVFGSGSHALLAARIAATLAEALDVPGHMACVYRQDEDQAERLTTVERVFGRVPQLSYRLVQTSNVGSLLEEINETDLLIIGSPSRSWIHRQVFRQESRLAAKAPVGSVVVRTAPPRVFQGMSEPAYVSPFLGAGEAARLYRDELIAVVANTKLIGVVRRSSLLMAGDGVPVEACMEETVSVGLTDPMSEAEEVSMTLGGISVPVVDREGAVVGMFGPTTY